MKTLHRLISKHKQQFANILPFQLTSENSIELDLSIDNSELLAIKDLNTQSLSDYINSMLKTSDKSFAFGGYGENRLVYKMSEHFGSGSEARSVHLGLDIWCPAETKVCAPLDSIIHSFQNNDRFGDYGPTIILKHMLEDQSFYTLYGHLTKSSLVNKKVGDRIESGEAFAAIGNSNENGNWPPHLHFQIIENMQDYWGDFPGVCSEQEQEKWLTICPDPMLMIKQ